MTPSIAMCQVNPEDARSQPVYTSDRAAWRHPMQCYMTYGYAYEETSICAMTNCLQAKGENKLKVP